jgi:mannan endo-1,4-beta-mannosidase
MKYFKTRKHKVSPEFLQRLLAVLGLFLIILVLFLAIFFSQKQGPLQPGAGNDAFVTRIGNKLYLNGHVFRFAGANLHWLGSFDDGQYPTFAQIDTGFADANEMNATVIRGMTLGVSVSCANCIEPSLNHFNEQAFKTIDYSIKVAASYHMHLIIPLVQNYQSFPHGSIWTFIKWRGLSNANQFYTNPTVIQDYKNYIAHVLNHVNQYTGIAYKDDPTIMAWATGNELNQATNSWTEMIAEYIKSIAPHQLVEDGRGYDYTGDPSQFQDPAIDLITSHFYPVNLQKMENDAELALLYNKAYYIGEWDWCNCNGGPPLSTILSTIENTPAIAGDTFWQLYPQGVRGNDQYSLEYPGQTPNFRQRAQLLTEHGLKMKEISKGALQTPTASLIPTASTAAASTPVSHFPLLIDAGGLGGVDSHGARWLADTGYIGGQVVDRGPIKIENTNDAWLYRTERYGMSGYSFTVPNGKYLVQLDFAETYPGITSAGQRVFSVDVQGIELSHLDVFQEAGGRDIALVKSFHVTVTNGKLTITFIQEVQSPEINAIEIQQQ